MSNIDNLGWRPIEEAQRDGDWLILSKQGENESGQHLGVWWVSKGRWVKHRSLEGGYWSDGLEALVPPTHFMPIDAPQRMAEVIEVLYEGIIKATHALAPLSGAAEDVQVALCECVARANEIVGRK